MKVTAGSCPLQDFKKESALPPFISASCWRFLVFLQQRNSSLCLCVCLCSDLPLGRRAVTGWGPLRQWALKSWIWLHLQRPCFQNAMFPVLGGYDLWTPPNAQQILHFVSSAGSVVNWNEIWWQIGDWNSVKHSLEGDRKYSLFSRGWLIERGGYSSGVLNSWSRREELDRPCRELMKHLVRPWSPLDKRLFL